MADHLSQLAHDIIKAGSYDKLTVTGPSPAKPHELLDNITPQQLLSSPLKSVGHGYAMLAGLWLWHDALHESHLIAQMDADSLRQIAPNPHQTPRKSSLKVGSVETVENDNPPNQQQLAEAATSLSFWHAIMHRREGDFSNAKYWYRRCIGHHMMKRMGAVASSLTKGFESDRLVARTLSDGWNPGGLVDLVEAVHDKPADPRHEVAVRLQRAEWTGLFDYCVHEAVEADRDDMEAWGQRVNKPS